MSTGRSFTLDAWVCAQHDYDETQTRAVLRYEPTLPWSLRFVVTHNGNTVIRHISRDMIREGFFDHGNDLPADDVQVRLDSNPTMVEIVVPITGDIIFTRVPKVQLAMVVEEILKMVPVGAEGSSFDWDAGLSHCEADAA